MNSPIICFGQQPCGFYPKRFLVAKILTARRLQSELGGEIVFFYHDSDHDPRETRTVLRHRKTHEQAQLNFTFDNKWQRKFSPLFAKRVPAGWHQKTESQLPNYIDHAQIDIFKATNEPNVADFCLEMYRRMGLLEGLTVVRSGDVEFRKKACDISDFFVDVQHEGELVRARHADDGLKLHEGGDGYINLPAQEFSKEQVSPSRDSRLGWMQSVIHCTHYVAGLSEQDYLNKADAPEIKYITRDEIDLADEAYIELPHQ
ncbi:MAG TPA: hypothetical protein V6C81_27685 [Planktothrix sp.]